MSNKQKYIEEEITFRELAKRIGIDDLDMPEIYDIKDEGYEILSYDHETNQETWKPLTAFVVKENVSDHYQVNTLHGTKDHRIFVNGEYVRLEDYVGAEHVRKPIQVVDCKVEDTHNYIAEGQINHNTTTPGGMAIPYTSSVRVRISSSGQQQIKDKDGNVVGIKVKAKTIKNKVARPFRECEFQIHFGVGVVEHEEVFDLFRAHCETLQGKGVPCGDKFVHLSGVKAWKSFVITDSNGEVVLEKKFHKPEFGQLILYNPEYQEYMEALYCDALTMHSEAMDHPTFKGINSDSIEEVEGAKDERASKK